MSQWTWPLSCGRHHSRLILLAVVLASFCVVRSYAATPNSFTWLDCPSPTPSPSPSPPASSINSPFQSNVFALLSALPSAASSAGFASLSRGEGTDRVFVRGICRGDSAPDDCAAYLQSAVSDINGHCNTNRRAAIWYDKCFLSYADTNASTVYEESFRQELYNYRNVSDKVAFERTYYTLMSRLTARAVNGTPESTSTAPMFATGQAVYDRRAPNGTMYGMVQCMRDRSAAECEKCLKDSVKQLPSCCYGHQGGVVLGYNCYVRVEIYTYYSLALNSPPAPPAPAPSPSNTNVGSKGMTKKDVVLAVALPVGTVFVVTLLVGFCLYMRKVNRKKTPQDNSGNEDISYVEPEQLNLLALRTATNNFSEANKLGEGGFGEVFKGTLQDGEEIAVKRLSKNSSQGFHELKNELVLAAKLKHRNLVRLLAVCLQEEKLLVYEYLSNRSLDTFLFDPVKRRMLDWSKRFAIICGIARGLLYLHEESRLKIIHRDLKPSNVLLDADMNPKISDFGLARAFGGDQSRDITRRPVGTLGYMSPEYAYCGHVSTKSDMFSFGVIVLEMVTGRRNNSTYESADSVSLMSYVWGRWRAGSTTDVVDQLLGGQYPSDEVLTCVEVGLLCVQENPADRPDASAVVLMLSSRSTTNDRQPPSRPAFVFGTGQYSSTSDSVPEGAWSTERAQTGDKQSLRAPVSENDVTISDLQPR